ncbi:hypothetical protein BH20VER1_BH20VER1_00200 [soil metagenome]
MKPTYQISHSARHGESRPQGQLVSKSPATDWSYRAPHTVLTGGSGSYPGPRSFRQLSDGFFSREARKESRLEGGMFGVIIALAAWPMVLAVLAAAGLLK